VALATKTSDRSSAASPTEAIAPEVNARPINPIRYPFAMLRRAQVVARGDEVLGPLDPAALPAIAAAGVFAAGRAAVGEAVVVIAPRDAVGVGQMRPARPGRCMGGAGGVRPDDPVHRKVMAHPPQQPLQDAHRVGARVHIHVEDAGLQHLRQAPMRGRSK
jgi:hypothetical protein